LITFDSGSEDPNIRRPLKAAREFRLAAEEALVLARLAAQAPKRQPVCAQLLGHHEPLKAAPSESFDLLSV
jgi:hypothetical protein